MSQGSCDYTPLPTDSGHGFGKEMARLGRDSSTRYPTRVLLSLSLLFNLVLTCSWLMSASKPFRFPEAGYSPAEHAIKYKTIKFHRGLGDDVPIYERPPSAEVDQAWEALYAYAASRVPKSEVDKMSNTTWPILHEQGNYVIALDAFHQLHCLDMLRQELHPGHNYTRMSKTHLRHCIGVIRQSLMCYADVTPVVWQWSTKFQEAEQRDDLLHTCRDFDAIQSWAMERSMGLLPDLTVYIDA
ncbi:hypothetical protein GGX14DRAFT_428972 [Mycena pura]|uniref:Cyclochlorotine biosynthesis protein O n=1 Tax=Mycena pura TaxID=153505 RepID=A0AAD6YLD7_9AGAR|nr:hypothetical protein GGX14DRAFT_428972 [Mycena pura]